MIYNKLTMLTLPVLGALIAAHLADKEFVMAALWTALVLIDVATLWGKVDA
jgi:hypothetical protein